MEEEMEALK
jgi:FtsZ-binding cell division protein ZapB